MFAIIGMVATWLIGLALSFYIPVILIMLFSRDDERGLISMIASIYVGGGCVALYVIGSLIYFAAT